MAVLKLAAAGLASGCVSPRGGNSNEGAVPLWLHGALATFALFTEVACPSQPLLQAAAVVVTQEVRLSQPCRRRRVVLLLGGAALEI